MKQTVGEQLRSARSTRGISLGEAVKATHISLVYLQELENDHPELLNSEAQARGFLRLYASFLEIPSAPLIAQWEEATHPEPETEEAQEIPAGEEDAPAGKPVADDSPLEEGEQPQVQEDDEKQMRETFSLRSWLDGKPALSSLFTFRKKESDSKSKTEGETYPESQEIDEPSQPEQTVARSSEDIFIDIGAALRERRDALELTLSDVERYTNVKRTYLVAMEGGRFDELPSTVQGRGMLNNYSKFIGLDDTWVMDAYARALQSLRGEWSAAKKPKGQPPLSVRLNIPEKWRRILNPDLILGSIFILAVFAFIIWGGSQIFGGADPTPTEAPSISEMLQQSPTHTMLADNGEQDIADAASSAETPVPGVTIAGSTPTQIATVDAAPLQLYIIAHDRAYLHIDVDGLEAFDGRVITDNVYTYSGEQSIDLATGNGAALEVYFNQEYLGSLGNVGEVVNISFSLQGLSTPTPELAPTPTVEPEGAMMEEMMEDY